MSCRFFLILHCSPWQTQLFHQTPQQSCGCVQHRKSLSRRQTHPKIQGKKTTLGSSSGLPSAFATRVVITGRWAHELPPRKLARSSKVNRKSRSLIFLVSDYHWAGLKEKKKQGRRTQQLKEATVQRQELLKIFFTAFPLVSVGGRAGRRVRVRRRLL